MKIKIYKEELELMLRFRTVQEIANIYNVSISKINFYRKKFGLTFQKKGRPLKK